MRILTRYVLEEHAGPFFFGMAAIAFVFLLNTVFRDLGRILGKGLPLIVILKFFGLNFAWILALAIPMAVLIATLMAFGRLSSDREIDAIKASAIPIQRLIFPVFGAAAILVLFMIYFNNHILPDFNHKLRQMYYDISRTKPMMSLDPNVFNKDIPNYTILVQEIDQRKNSLKGVFINDTSDPQYNKTIIAERGNVDFIKEQERIIFTLYNGEVHEVESKNLERYRKVRFEKQAITISVPEMFLESSNDQNRGDREKSAKMLMNDIHQDQGVLRERESNLRRIVKWDLMELFPAEFTANFSAQNENKAYSYYQKAELRVQRLVDQNEGIASEIGLSRSSINSLLVEVHKKYSIPFACLVFVLIGAPLGILVRQSGFATAGWLSIVFFLIYWAFLIGGEQLADRRILGPVLAMWAADLVVGLSGVFLLIRTLREATLFPSARLSPIKIKTGKKA
jgi:lipopolysaccharide export system permease protein